MLKIAYESTMEQLMLRAAVRRARCLDANDFLRVLLVLLAVMRPGMVLVAMVLVDLVLLVLLARAAGGGGAGYCAERSRAQQDRERHQGRPQILDHCLLRSHVSCGTH